MITLSILADSMYAFYFGNDLLWHVALKRVDPADVSYNIATCKQIITREVERWEVSADLACVICQVEHWPILSNRSN